MTVTEYSRHARISRQNLHKHLRTGLLVKTNDKKIDVKKADQVLSILHGDKIETLSEKMDFLGEKREAEARYRTAKAAMAELDLKIKEGQYIETKKVQNDLSFCFYGLKQRLMAWSRSLPPLLSHKDERAISKVLDQQTWNLLNELSQSVKSIIKYAKSYERRKSKKS